MKSAQSKPNPSPILSPNYATRACKKGGGSARSLFERKILLKSPEPENKAQRKVKKENPRELWVRIIRGLSGNYLLRIKSGNYFLRIISGNYHLVYHHAEKLRFIGILAYPKIKDFVINLYKCRITNVV